MTAKEIKTATLSPRELGHALSVSESSVKRWIDSGRLEAVRTAGGHRRVDFLTALRFARESGRELVHPSVLGLPGLDERYQDEATALADRIFELLTAGQDQEVARILLASLSSRAVEPAAFFDGPVRLAMVQIGHLWEGGQEGIFVEHRATQILLRVLDQTEALFEPESGAPVAVGGTLPGDVNLLPGRMASISLSAEGFRTVNLGADTPVEVFLEAAEELDASLVWISTSQVADPVGQGRALQWLNEKLVQRGTSCILGGREVDRLEFESGRKPAIGASMQDLVRLSREVAGGHEG